MHNGAGRTQGVDSITLNRMQGVDSITLNRMHWGATSREWLGDSSFEMKLAAAYQFLVIDLIWSFLFIYMMLKLEYSSS